MPSATQAYLDGSRRKQLIGFVSGEGGTGKSFLIDALYLFCQIEHGKTPGLFGPCLKLAPTAAAAHNIGGFTWQSALGCSNEAHDQHIENATRPTARSKTGCH